MKTIALTIGMFLGIQAFACMMAPLEIVWKTPKDSSFHYSITKEGLVSIVDAKDHAKIRWTTTLKGYTPHSDQVFVVNGGDRVVRVRGNHTVNKLSDIAVETVTKDGQEKSYAASELIATLQDGGEKVKMADGTIKVMRHSMSPNFKWMKSIKSVDGNGITVINALEQSKTVSWN